MKNQNKNNYLRVGLVFLVGFFIFLSIRYVHSEKVNNNIKKDKLIKYRLDDEHQQIEKRSLLKKTFSEQQKFLDYTENEFDSLYFLTSLIEASIQDLPLKNVMEQLRKLNLKPTLLKDENDYTGELDVLRTKNALEGTRYFHAQYFTQQDGSQYLQHLSFEFRPGKESFDFVKQLIQYQLGFSIRPSFESSHFISWKVKGRNIWIKQLEANDLNAISPFNSYDPKKDIGAIRVTSEVEIH
jgi:hypothetical protein